MLSVSCRKFSTSMLSRGRQGLFSQGLKVSSRLLCTPTNSSEEPPKRTKGPEMPLSFIETWRPYSMKIGVGAAASLTLYGLSSFMWDMTYNIMTMSPASGRQRCNTHSMPHHTHTTPHHTNMLLVTKLLYFILLYCIVLYCVCIL